jgi:hypothetical protein
VANYTCLCGRYAWEAWQCIDGAHYCQHCGAPVSGGSTDHGDEPRTYFRDADGALHLTERGAMTAEVGALRLPEATPINMRPSKFCALPEFDGL